MIVGSTDVMPSKVKFNHSNAAAQHRCGAGRSSHPIWSLKLDGYTTLPIERDDKHLRSRNDMYFRSDHLSVV